MGNPDGEDKPNKKFYDPRVWIRKAEEAMIKRADESFEFLNSKGSLGIDWKAWTNSGGHLHAYLIRRSHYCFLAVNFRFFDVANFNPVYLQASIIPIIEGRSIF